MPRSAGRARVAIANGCARAVFASRKCSSGDGHGRASSVPVPYGTDIPAIHGGYATERRTRESGDCKWMCESGVCQSKMFEWRWPWTCFIGTRSIRYRYSRHPWRLCHGAQDAREWRLQMDVRERCLPVENVRVAMAMDVLHRYPFHTVPIFPPSMAVMPRSTRLQGCRSQS